MLDQKDKQISTNKQQMETPEVMEMEHNMLSHFKLPSTFKSRFRGRKWRFAVRQITLSIVNVHGFLVQSRRNLNVHGRKD
jgi:hypothetical protein